MGLQVIPEQEVAFGQITSVIEASQQIAICAHTSPDGDAIGSGLALGMIIETTWPHKQVTNLLADDAPVPRIYNFLPGGHQRWFLRVGTRVLPISSSALTSRLTPA